MRRILHVLELHKIAAVDRPCQTPAVMTIMKRRIAVTPATPDPDEDETKRPKDGPSTGSTRFRHLLKGLPPMNAITEILAKADRGEPVSKADVAKIFEERAAEIQKANPRLTAAQAFAKAYEDPNNARFRKLYMEAPNLQVVETGAVSKRGPDDLGWRCLQAQADVLRKADPKLTPAQAFAKAYEDPANRDFVRIHKSAQQAA